MDQWLHDIELELRRAEEARTMGHDGRLRTSARRVAGIALSEYTKATSGARKDDGFLALLAACALDRSVPEVVRAAAQRLAARVGTDFSSPSLDPLGDADVIVSFVRSALQKS
jgi:hypothetical protein